MVGLGTGYIAKSDEKTAIEALIYAYEHGINYADLATAGAKTFSYYGTAFRSVWEKMYYQVHFGANYATGEYGWTTDLETVKRQIDWQMQTLKTDYINYGFIHCLDEENDRKEYQENGVLQFLLDMQKSGAVKHIGFSKHTPLLAHQVLDTGLVGQLMFSIIPDMIISMGTMQMGVPMKEWFYTVAVKRREWEYPL